MGQTQYIHILKLLHTMATVSDKLAICMIM